MKKILTHTESLEREKLVFTLRMQGSTYKEVSATIGVSQSRCQQIFLRHERRLRREEGLIQSHWTDGLPCRLANAIRSSSLSKEAMIRLIVSGKHNQIPNVGKKSLPILSEYLGVSSPDLDFNDERIWLDGNYTTKQLREKMELLKKRKESLKEQKIKELLASVPHETN